MDQDHDKQDDPHVFSVPGGARHFSPRLDSSGSARVGCRQRTRGYANESSLSGGVALCFACAARRGAAEGDGPIERHVERATGGHRCRRSNTVTVELKWDGKV